MAGVAPRLDIDVFLDENHKAFNLFILAYDKLQKVLRSDKMGFFQIAGKSTLLFPVTSFT